MGDEEEEELGGDPLVSPGKRNLGNVYDSPSYSLRKSDRDYQLGGQLHIAAIWTSGTNVHGEALFAAVNHFLDSYGLRLDAVERPHLGSWWQRFRVAAAKALSSDEVRQRLAAAERGLEAHLLDSKVAENDKLKSESVTMIIGALADTDQAVIVLGQLVIVKNRSNLIVKTVDPLTAAKIERSGTLLTDPAAVAQLLSTVHAESPDEKLGIVQAAQGSADPPAVEQ